MRPAALVRYRIPRSPLRWKNYNNSSPTATLLLSSPSFTGGGQTLSDDDMPTIASIGTRLGEHTGHDASQPIKSRDGEAAIVSVPMSQDQSDAATADAIDQLRNTAHGDTPEGMDVQIT